MAFDDSDPAARPAGRPLSTNDWLGRAGLPPPKDTAWKMPTINICLDHPRLGLMVLGTIRPEKMGILIITKPACLSLRPNIMS